MFEFACAPAGIHQFELLSLLARLSLSMFVPFWLLIDVRSMMYHSFENTNTESVAVLLFLDGALNFLQVSQFEYT